MKTLIIALAFLMAGCSSNSSSGALSPEKAHVDGNEGPNGGDTCEARIQVIRDDIADWIRAGGSAGLELPSTLTLNDYDKNMLKQIAEAKISCTASRIDVGGLEKVCKNFRDSKGVPSIVCNSQRFNETSDSDQYILIHHELAGLAGFEANEGASSVYSISNQIAGYLVETKVKKLAVHACPKLSGFYGLNAKPEVDIQYYPGGASNDWFFAGDTGIFEEFLARGTTVDLSVFQDPQSHALTLHIGDPEKNFILDGAEHYSASAPEADGYFRKYTASCRANSIVIEESGSNNNTAMERINTYRVKTVITATESNVSYVRKGVVYARDGAKIIDGSEKLDLGQR